MICVVKFCDWRAHRASITFCLLNSPSEGLQLCKIICAATRTWRLQERHISLLTHMYWCEIPGTQESGALRSHSSFPWETPWFPCLEELLFFCCAGFRRKK